MMYDENKWNENEQKNDSVIDSTAEVLEEKGIGEAAEQKNPEAADSEPAQKEPENQNQSYREPYPRGYYENPNPNPAMNRQPQRESGYQRQSYQNPNYQNQNYQYQNRPNYQYQGGQSQPPKKKGSLLKKAALIVAGALLFGGVSGATMFGVNRVAEILFPYENESKIAAESQETLENTPVIQESIKEPVETTSTGVVIEDVSPIVDAAMPSVVAITNTTLYKSSTWFGQTQTYEIPSSGSGIIVGENDTELLVVTNNHVIEDSTSISVTFIDETTVDAAIKGTDSASDLAVIAIPLDEISAETKSKIKAATIGDSDSLKMGQGVIAIGNALGHGQSVTVGHVSALNREITVDGITKTVIQTDAAINPGNSGGALLNAKGELVGINEAKYSDESVEGVGYAIPISLAMEIIEDLKLRTTKIEVDESEQGYIGIQVQNIDSVTAQMYGMPEGVYIYKITENSAASESDLREKDIITEFDGEKVRTNADLTNLLTYYKAGSTVTITVQSLENGEYVEREVEVTLKNRPQEDEEPVQPRP